MNLHAFPFAVFPRVPDADPPRAAVDAFALTAPQDRLLPFVLTRPANPTRRLDCARLIDADTGATVQELIPSTDLPTPAHGLQYEKYTLEETDYFVYFGAILPGVVLPCGRRLRLVVDEFQSAAFCPAVLSDCLLVEWYHTGLLQDAPYGLGLRQRLYLPGSFLIPADPRTVRQTTLQADTQQERDDFVALVETSTFTTLPVPAFVRSALYAAQVHAFFSVDGEARRLTGVKSTVFGALQDGRWSLEATSEELTLLTRTTCPPAVLQPVPAGDYEPHRWRCGDTSDLSPDYQRTGNSRCVQDQTATYRRTGNSRCVQA